MTLLKQVRRSGEIFQLFRRNQSRSGDRRYLLILASQKLILASQQGYFPNLNRLTQSVFRFSRNNYTLALPINSPPEAQREKKHTQAEAQREKKGAQAEARTERDG